MSNPLTWHFVVKGMSCGHCVRAVTNAVTAIDPQAQVQIDLASGQVEVTTQASAEAVKTSIVEDGYEIVEG
jgi:copper chaperone